MAGRCRRTDIGRARRRICGGGRGVGCCGRRELPTKAACKSLATIPEAQRIIEEQALDRGAAVGEAQTVPELARQLHHISLRQLHEVQNFVASRIACPSLLLALHQCTRPRPGCRVRWRLHSSRGHCLQSEQPATFSLHTRCCERGRHRNEAIAIFPGRGCCRCTGLNFFLDVQRDLRDAYKDVLLLNEILLAPGLSRKPAGELFRDVAHVLLETPLVDDELARLLLGGVQLLVHLAQLPQKFALLIQEHGTYPVVPLPALA
mmetsp:Transcript_125714/g.402360  ORF Transcript_125714/g.402360 Transcript_125714/m.402360 type:complete len:262 (-) Transcript_125714:1491-2276(-)